MTVTVISISSINFLGRGEEIWVIFGVFMLVCFCWHTASSCRITAFCNWEMKQQKVLSFTQVKRKDCATANLVECWCKDRHKETIVDVTNQLVSDIRVGHLGAVNIKEHVSQACSQAGGCSHLSHVNTFFMRQSFYRAAHVFTWITALQNSSELRNWMSDGIWSQSSLCRQCHSSLGTSSLVGRDEYRPLNPVASTCQTRFLYLIYALFI